MPFLSVSPSEFQLSPDMTVIANAVVIATVGVINECLHDPEIPPAIVLCSMHPRTVSRGQRTRSVPSLSMLTLITLTQDIVVKAKYRHSYSLLN